MNEYRRSEKIAPENLVKVFGEYRTGKYLYLAVVASAVLWGFLGQSFELTPLWFFLLLATVICLTLVILLVFAQKRRSKPNQESVLSRPWYLASMILLLVIGSIYIDRSSTKYLLRELSDPNWSQYKTEKSADGRMLLVAKVDVQKDSPRESEIKLVDSYQSLVNIVNRWKSESNRRSGGLVPPISVTSSSSDGVSVAQIEKYQDFVCVLVSARDQVEANALEEDARKKFSSLNHQFYNVAKQLKTGFTDLRSVSTVR
jgi:hypothetical protein